MAVSIDTTIPANGTAVGRYEPVSPNTQSGYSGYKVIRRNGDVTPFDPNRIALAMKKAFLAVEGKGAEASRRIEETVRKLTDDVVATLTRRAPAGGTIHIEAIQDQVELALMRHGEHKIARAYVLYREERARERAAAQSQAVGAQPAKTDKDLSVVLDDGTRQAIDWDRLQEIVYGACEGLNDVHPRKIIDETYKNIFDGITEEDLGRALVMSARALVETEPDYTYVSSRLLLDELRREVLSSLAGCRRSATPAEMSELYSDYFADYVNRGVEVELLDPKLQEFDLKEIGAALDADRDLKFTYLGLQTLYDRYLLHWKGKRFELPQAMFMRVAMGLALNEVDREERAIEFYNVLSSFDFMSSTPTLFNSGTRHPQLSSCFLTTVPDDLKGIFDSIRDNAMLAKFSGGLGNDWTRVRGMGAHIKGTNGKSQGVVPFMKVANDTAVAVNQGGKRKGAVCGYLETWHIDVEEFLELRKNTGDDRRRTHDMNTANWIPDLFMKRVHEDGEWTLFSPNEVADLHDKIGKEFEEAYRAYEAKADRGEINVFKRIKANDLWRKMLSMLYETGHPWITFKDPCNLRSPQQHIGRVHSSNLCTEITLNTSDKETAVCNLGSINLVNHLTADGISLPKLERTVRTAMRMLDNVIDLNFYPTPQARHSNLRHRPVGLGVMGFQDALFALRIPYQSDQAVEFADRCQEAVSFYSIQASSELATERGSYATFEGSLWSRGILPHDSIDLLAQNRGEQYLDQDRSAVLDWDTLRVRVQTDGMRNSNTMAIAPTATISNICGVSQSIEPIYQNLFVKSNMSGEFTVVNPYLIHDLKERGLWDDVMAHDLKYYDGSVQPIDRVPEDLKLLYATAFEMDPKWLVKCASRRQKWIDQAQSLNLYMAAPSGKKLDELYRYAWKTGLKTTYYLRAIGATHAEKSTISDGALNAVGGRFGQGGAVAQAAPANGHAATTTAPVIGEAPMSDTEVKQCLIDDPDCEACQ